MATGGTIETIEVNGWSLFGHTAFLRAFDDLMDQVEALAKSDPHNLHHHAHSKLFRKISDCVFARVPQNPADKCFLGGGAFEGHTHWRRAKQGMPPRYRLFFQFHSAAPKSIIYAWFNGDDTLRKAGSRTDCYAVFVGMVERGYIPDDFETLLAQCDDLKDRKPSRPA